MPLPSYVLNMVEGAANYLKVGVASVLLSVWKDQCPKKPAAPTKPPAGYSCTKCKAIGDHYSEDCQAMADDQAKVRFTHADLAAVAAEMGMQFEPVQPMVGWEDGPIRGV